MFATIRSAAHLYHNATSTRWPGASGLAINFLFLALVITTAQFAVILALGVELFQLDDKALCWTESVQSYEWRTFPAMYMTTRSVKDRLWMGENTPVVGIVYASILSPLFVLIFLSTMLRLHFRCTGISNRQGMSWSFWTMCLLLVGVIQDAWLGPDASVQRDTNSYSYCQIRPSEFDSIKAQRSQRAGLGVASEVLSGLGALCMILYLSLAITAARKNALTTPKSSLCLQNLTSAPPSPSHPAPPPPCHTRSTSSPFPSGPNHTHTLNPTGRHTPTGGSSPISNLSLYPPDHPLSQPGSDGRIGITIEREVRVESRRRSNSGWDDDEGDGEMGMGLGYGQRVWTPLSGEGRGGFAIGDGDVVDGGDKENEN